MIKTTVWTVCQYDHDFLWIAMQVYQLLGRFLSYFFSDIPSVNYLRTERCIFTVFDNGRIVSIPAHIPTKSRPAINIS